MKNSIIILLFFCSQIFSQQKEKIEKYEGIWIAEEYYNSFEKTKNCIESKDSFDPNEPVGLRINTSEIKNGILNIGFSSLHDHLLRPEVSQYILNGKDTISEQGYFKIKLTEQNNLNEFPTSEIIFFSDNLKSSLILDKNKIILYRPKSKELDERKIKFVRIKKIFDNDYKYPNPLYYYTRKKLLTGNYILKDSTDKITTTNLKILPNGTIIGYEKFNGKKIYYSTDIYCGLPVIDEFVLICDEIKNYNSNCEGFVFKKVNNTTIHLYKTFPRNELDEKDKELEKLHYKLIKITP